MQIDFKNKQRLVVRLGVKTISASLLLLLLQLYQLETPQQLPCDSDIWEAGCAGRRLGLSGSSLT